MGNKTVLHRFDDLSIWKQGNQCARTSRSSSSTLSADDRQARRTSVSDRSSPIEPPFYASRASAEV